MCQCNRQLCQCNRQLCQCNRQMCQCNRQMCQCNRQMCHGQHRLLWCKHLLSECKHLLSVCKKPLLLIPQGFQDITSDCFRVIVIFWAEIFFCQRKWKKVYLWKCCSKRESPDLEKKVDFFSKKMKIFFSTTPFGVCCPYICIKKMRWWRIGHFDYVPCPE